jgi:hypothetical protein
MNKWQLSLALLVISCLTLFFAGSFSKDRHRQDRSGGTLALILPHIRGAINKHVTQQTIMGTICVPGYTRSIRPPVGYTQALKAGQIKALHYADTNIKHYEEDHLIPLELGGNPTSPQNLWPEPWAQAHQSDPFENQLHREVCAHTKTLNAARLQIKQFKFTNG